MRLRPNALLALPALLSALVVAIPPPAAYFPLALRDAPTAQQQPRWRNIADRLIEQIWGIGKDEDVKVAWQKESQDPLLLRSTLARYGGDVVLRFNVSNAEEVQSLAEAANTLLLDVWDFTYDWVDIRLAKDIVPSLLGLLPDSLQHSHTALLHEHELALAVHNTYPSPVSSNPTEDRPSQHDSLFTTALSRTTEGDDSSVFFQEYRSLRVIDPWMRLLSTIFSTHVRLISIGKSYEGREILALRVGVHPTNDDLVKKSKRKTVLITGGLHAREWISTTTVNYVAFNLITSYGKTARVTDMLEEYDFVFIPTVNPDGYAYTWETDRLWRKNRQPTSIRFCRGVDLDHGFGFEWNGKMTAGNPCSESYAGERPFEAFESNQLAEWARNETLRNNVEFVGFLDLHSYSEQILYPYSYSCKDVPPSKENLEELAFGLKKAIHRAGSVWYESMPACEGNVVVSHDSGSRTVLPRMESSGGSAIDWFYHEMHVKYAYQIKLRDRGTYGFLLPKENIIPTGKEILSAVLYFGDFLTEGYPKQVLDDEEDTENGRQQVTDEKHYEKLPASFVDAKINDDWLMVDEVVEDGPRWDLRRRRRR